MINSIQEIYDAIKTEKPKRVALAQAADMHSLPAVMEAAAAGYAIPILIGNKEKIKAIAKTVGIKLGRTKIIDCEEGKEPEIAVDLVKNGKADVVMKGLIESAPFLKAVIKGIRKEDSIISAIALVELKRVNRVCFITDLAINPRPDFNAKETILLNALGIIRKLGYERPKVAVLSASETLNPKMQSSMDAAIIAQKALDGHYGDCVVAGPISFDLAMSEEAAIQKQYYNEVAGSADVLLVPDIETGNSLYKALMLFSDIETGGIVAGTTAPVAFCSRADSIETKKNTLATAIYLASR